MSCLNDFNSWTVEELEAIGDEGLKIVIEDGEITGMTAEDGKEV